MRKSQDGATILEEQRNRGVEEEQSTVVLRDRITVMYGIVLCSTF